MDRTCGLHGRSYIYNKIVTEKNHKTEGKSEYLKQNIHFFWIKESTSNKQKMTMENT